MTMQVSEPRPAVLDIHPETFGLEAVTEADQQAWYARQEPLGLLKRAALIISCSDHPAAELTTGGRTHEAKQVRKQIAEFSDIETFRLSEFAQTADSSTARERLDLGLTSDAEWARWLTSSAPEADERLFKILRAHVARVHELQHSPEFTREVEKHKARIKVAIRSGVHRRWLSEVAEAAIDKVDDVPVYAADHFNPHYSKNLNSGASYVISGGYIDLPTLRPGTFIDTSYDAGWLIEDAVDNLPHEFGHAVIETTAQEARDNKPHKLFESEAGAQQFSLVAQGMSPDRIHTTESDGHPTSYSTLMEAHEILLGGSEAPLFTRAYSGGIDDVKALEASIDAAWGCSDLRAKLYLAATKFNRHYRRLQPDMNRSTRLARTGLFMTQVLKQIDTEPRMFRSRGLRRIIRRSHFAMLEMKEDN